MTRMKYRVLLSNGGNVDLFADGYDINSTGVLSIVHAREIHGKVQGCIISSYAAGHWLAIHEIQGGRPVYEQSGEIIVQSARII